MESKYEKQLIDRFLFLKDGQISSLKKNNIKTLGQLSNQTKSSLRNIGFVNQEINKIDVELQLLGLGLKG